jgi:multiple sugar transport system substrate-binding protein
MMIDGSFRIGDVKTGAKFDWGVAELPTYNNIHSNYASYWSNAIAKGVSGDKLAASEKFIKFLSSPDVEKDWMKNVGELPAAKSLLSDPSLTSDPVYGPFIKGLGYAHATFFADETKERDTIVNGINEIELKHADVTKTFNNMVKQEQQIRDDFFSKQ